MTMLNRDLHLSDQELLLFADGELSPRYAARLRKHLTECWACRARATELEGAIADFVHLHRSTVAARVPRDGGLRSSLKAQLAVAAAGRSPRLWSLPKIFLRPAAYACAALLIVAAGLWMMRSDSLDRWGSVQAIALPNRLLTPGYTRPVKVSDLCGARHWDAPAARDASMKRKVFGEYGLPVSISNSYELDYLITPELGGADDVRNLWPEPYASTEWNAHVKDELESRLHTMVCDGQVDLATAQKDIATNWIAAYKRYFHTESPLPNQEGAAVSRAGNRNEIALLAGRFSLWSFFVAHG
jgi:hypothetical protein